MLIGMLCQVIESVTEEAKEERDAHLLEEEIVKVMSKLEACDDGLLELAELEYMCEHPLDFMSLVEMGVDYVALVNQLRLYMADAVVLTTDDFKYLVLQCKGT